MRSFLVATGQPFPQLLNAHALALSRADSTSAEHHCKPRGAFAGCQGAEGRLLHMFKGRGPEGQGSVLPLGHPGP